MGKQYRIDHWIRSKDPVYVLKTYNEQQSKAYSRTKNRFIEELLGDLNGKRFLDYGCGPGMFAVHAAREGAAVVFGIDAEESVLEAARLFASQEGFADKCRFTAGKELRASLPDLAFDVILLKDVIEHVEDDRTLLCAVSNALAPDGFVVLSTQNALSLNYLIEGGYNRLIKCENDWHGWDETHLRFYTPAKLSRKLYKAGLKTVAWRSAYIIPHKFKAPASSGRQFYRLESLTAIDRVFGRTFPWKYLGWSLMVKAVQSW